MNKRKQTSDDPTDSSSTTTTIIVGNTFPLPKKPLTRHMYTIEEQRFVWYHRDIKKMSAKMVHKNFYDQYNPEVAVSVDSLTQLAGRIRRTQPWEVVSCVSGERWAIAAKPAASEESQSEQLSSVMLNGDSSWSTEPEQCTATDGQCPPSNLTDQSSPKIRRRRMYTIEEHRFVWYHRHFLQMNSHQTYKSFQKEFKAPTVTRANLDQLATRLERQRDPNVVARIHNESWAVKKVVPGVVPVDVESRNTGGEGSGAGGHTHTMA